jgi:hypothetical protein
MSINGPSKIVREGLVLSLDAGNIKSYASGSTSWYDLSKNGNTAVLTNGPTFDSGSGGSVLFDGTNDYAIITNSPTLNMGNGSFTGELWLKIANYSSGERMIFEYNVWGASGTYQLSTFGNTLRINFPEAYAALKYLDYSYTPLTTNVWMQIVGQFDTVNNNYNLFINGTSVSQVTGTTQEISNVTSNMYIMSRGGTGLFLPGNLASFRMYNRALSASEILKNFNCTRTRFRL